MTAQAPADGRVRRRLENRQAVVDALMDLISDGAFEPSIEEVAAHASLSVRSIQRYFGTLKEAREELRRELIDFVTDQLARASGPVLAGAGLDQRCASIIDARFELYDRIGPMIRTSRSRHDPTGETAERFERSRLFVEAQVPERFAPELEGLDDSSRQLTLALVNTLLSFESVDVLLSRVTFDRIRLRACLISQLRLAFGR